MAPRRFFRVLLNDFLYRLPIPPTFVREAMEVEPWNNAAQMVAKMRVLLGGKCYWKVEVTMIRDVVGNCYFYGDKWEELVRKFDLRLGYFLVFSHHGDMMFDLTIFDLTGCSKAYDKESYEENHRSSEQQPSLQGEIMEVIKLPTIIDISDDEDQDGTKEISIRYYKHKRKLVKSTTSRSRKKTCKKPASWTACRSKFIKCISHCQLLGKSPLNIPLSFDSPKYIDGKSFVWLKIGDEEGSWKVNVIRDRKFFRLGGGFVKFCRENNVKEGQRYRFQIKSGNKEKINDADTTTIYVRAIDDKK